MNNQVYQYVTDRIIAKLEAGTIPWVKPWNNAKYEAAYNADSGRCYTGINALLLDEGGYMTFNSIKAHGWKLIKGAKASMVTFWKFIDTTDKDGNPDRVPYLRYYNVFHESMIEGYIKPDRIEKAQAKAAVLDFIPADAAHDTGNRYLIGDCIPYHEGGNAAYYVPARHSITMPKKAHFKSIEEFYATLFHEIGHSTMKGTGRSSLSYAKEEGVAELCSAYMMRHFNLSNEGLIDNTAAYIASWISALKKDPKLIVSTASKAQRAFEYILQVAENTQYADIHPLDVEENDDAKAAAPVTVQAPEPEPEPDDDGPGGGAPAPDAPTVTEPEPAAPVEIAAPEIVPAPASCATISVPLRELKQAAAELKKVLSAVKKSSIRAMLETVTGTIDKYNGLTLRANNLYQSVEFSINGTGPAIDANFYVGIYELNAAVKSSISDPVIISITGPRHADDPGTISIDGMTMMQRYATAAPDAMHIEAEKADSFMMSADVLQKAIAKTIGFVSGDMNKPILTGVNVKVTDTGATFAALDGYKLSVYAAGIDSFTNDIDIVIPAAALAIVARNIKKGPVIIQTDGRYLYARDAAGACTITTRLLEGEYVKYENILPTEHATGVTLQAAALIQAIKPAIGTGPDKKDLFTLRIRPDAVSVNVKSDTINYTRELQATRTGPGLDIAFNPRLLVPALDALDAGSITVQLNTAISPAYVKQGAHTVLVLPVRMHE